MTSLLTNGIISPIKAVQTNIPFSIGGEVAIEKKEFEINIEIPILDVEVNLCLV